MSLPLPWVDKIFDKLTLIYGQAFIRRWADVDLQRVKEDWAHELDGLDKAPKTIAYALQNLPPEKPPTALEFRAIAYRMPAESVPQIPLARLEPNVVAQHVAKARVLPNRGSVGNKEWAHSLIRRHESGENIRPYSLKLAKSALEPRVNV